MKRLSLAIIAALALATSVPAQQLAQQGAAIRAVVPFNVGERMDYDVRFGPLRVGSGTMEVGRMDTIRGREAWHTVFTVNGGTLFYRVRDKLESWIDVVSLSSLRHVQDLSEGDRDRERHYEIYPERRTYSQDGGEELPSVDGPLDDGSFLYYVRTIPLEVGREYVLTRYFRPDRNPVRIRVLRKERIRVPAGTFDAIVVQPIINSRGLFSENGRAEIWLSDDSQRIMLQLKSRLSVGSLNLYLKSYRPPTNSAVTGQLSARPAR